MKTLQMTLAIMMIASGIVVAPGLAQETSGLVLHMAPADYSGCAALPEPGLTCSDIEIIGDSSQPQYLFVSTFGFNDTNYPGWGGSADAGIGAVQFGISYDDAAITLLGSMVLCTGGAEIPQTDPIAWPAPNTGNAVTWAGACYESPSPDDFAVVGYFTVAQNSTGLFFIQGDPRILGSETAPDGVAVNDCEATFYGVSGEKAYSSASMNGADPDARKSCSMPVPIEETTWGQLKSGYSD